MLTEIPIIYLIWCNIAFIDRISTLTIIGWCSLKTPYNSLQPLPLDRLKSKGQVTWKPQDSCVVVTRKPIQVSWRQDQLILTQPVRKCTVVHHINFQWQKQVYQPVPTSELKQLHKAPWVAKCEGNFHCSYFLDFLLDDLTAAMELSH